MSTRKRRRGLTLPELITAAALLVLTFCVMAQVLMPTAFMASVEQSRSEVQQGALVFIHTVRKGLLNAVADTVTVGTVPPAIAFVTVSDSDPYDPVTASPRLSPYFTILWFDAIKEKIFTRVWPPEPPILGGYDFTDLSNPPMLSENDLRTLTEIGPARPLVSHVESLRIDDSHGAINSTALAYPLRFTITCAMRSSKPHATADEMERQTLSTRVTPGDIRW